MKAYVVGVDEVDPADPSGGEQAGDVRRDPSHPLDRDGAVPAGVEQFGGARAVPGAQRGQVCGEPRRGWREPGIDVGVTARAAAIDTRPQVTGFGQAGTADATRHSLARGTAGSGDESAQGRGVHAFEQHCSGAEFELDDVLGAPQDTDRGVEYHVDLRVVGHPPTVSRACGHGPVIHRAMP